MGNFAPHKGLWLLPLLTICTLGRVSAQQPAATSTSPCFLALDGQSRSYHVHVPKNLTGPAPLVVALHADNAAGLQFEKTSGFSQLADEQGFIVAYPDAVRGQWQAEEDVEFVRAMVAEISQQYDIDSKRVFATGLSEGGQMSSVLGAEAADLFSAIAPVTAALPATKEGFKLTHPLSVMFIQGTDDPIAPYAGIKVAVERWCHANGIEPQAGVVEMLPDLDRQDGCRVNRVAHSGGKWGTEVVLLEVEGGGHTWPGALVPPSGKVGRTCRDFKASQEIWSFFAEHPRNVPKNSKSRKSPQRLVHAF